MPASPLRFSRDGEPLCIPPALPTSQEVGRLCEAARRRLPEVEAELRRRLSGSDRSIEAQELERHLSGDRSDATAERAGAAGERPERQSTPASERGPGLGSDHRGAAAALATDPRRGDGLLESGLLALCAGSLLGLPVSLPLAEALALRGVRTTRGALAQDHPPRALDALGALRRGQPLPSRNGAGAEGEGSHPPLEILRPLSAKVLSSHAARIQIAMAAAGLARPLIAIVSRGEGDAVAGLSPEGGFLHAGLPGDLLELVKETAAPHPVYDAAPLLARLRAALIGKNPWRLFHIAELPWRGQGDEALTPQPTLSPAGEALLQQALHDESPRSDEAARKEGADHPLPPLLLSCLAIAAAERLSHLAAPPYGAAPGALAPLRPLPGDAALAADKERILAALRGLISRPLNPGQDGEPALFLAQAARALQDGLGLLEAHHPEELGRLLVPAVAGCARVRLFAFPRETPQALVVHGRHVSGGDLRAHIELLPLAPGGGLLGR